MSNKFELLEGIDNNINNFISFANLSKVTILNEKKESKLALINQLLGHYKQLIMKSIDIIKKEEYNKYLSFQKEIEEKLEKINHFENISNVNLEDIENIYNNIDKQYSRLEKEIISATTEEHIIEYNNLIGRINENIILINKLDLSRSVIDELIEAYNYVKNNKDIEGLNLLLKKTNEIIVNSSNINDKKGNFKERIFSLFAKINDQIVDSNFYQQEDIIYGLYTLEDNSKYYAIIKEEKEIKILDQEFSNLPNLILTKDKIIDTCKIIIKNAGIYYDLNEYMRYIEKGYKTRVTKEIDEVIKKYKDRLRTLEASITAQLSFIDEIALIVNNLPSRKYPNIKYNDVPLSNFFESNINDSKSKEINRIIKEKLLNPNIKSEFDTKEILKTLYSNETINQLINSNYTQNKIKPNVDTSENVNNNIIREDIKTNYEKISNYLKTRVEELSLLQTSPKINVTITKDTNALFKDINTVLDLNTAIVICDKVYKEGQGIYATLDYLKTGNTLKFTSKYKARLLANDVDRNQYIKKLIENILMQSLYFKNKKITNILTDKVNTLISDSNITIEPIINKLLSDDEMLSLFIKEFDYDFLDKLKEKYQEVENLLKNDSKEQELLTELKKININLC